MIGIFGGTFNPVHWGHLRTAVEIKKALSIETMFLVPCGIPPHRNEPEIDSGTRLEMLNAAVKDVEGLQIDDRELQRKGLSYTVDTLKSIRNEIGNVPIGLCVGADAFVDLDTWHEWRQLFQLADLIVAYRPGWPIDELEQRISLDLIKMLQERLVKDSEQLHKTSSGCVLTQKVTDIDISSSKIRQCIRQGKSIKEYVPPGVLQIIQSKQLYQNIERS